MTTIAKQSLMPTILGAKVGNKLHFSDKIPGNSVVWLGNWWIRQIGDSMNGRKLPGYQLIYLPSYLFSVLSPSKHNIGGQYWLAPEYLTDQTHRQYQLPFRI
jgi:hypothetical protein